MERFGHHLGRLLRFVKDKNGVSAVEYALIIVAIVAVVGGGVAILGEGFKDLFQDVSTQMQNAASDIDPGVEN